MESMKIYQQFLILVLALKILKFFPWLPQSPNQRTGMAILQFSVQYYGSPFGEVVIKTSWVSLIFFLDLAGFLL